MRLPDLVLIGTGSSLQLLRPDLQKGLRAKGISYEALDTVRPALALLDHPFSAAGRRTCSGLRLHTAASIFWGDKVRRAAWCAAQRDCHFQHSEPGGAQSCRRLLPNI